MTRLVGLIFAALLTCASAAADDVDLELLLAMDASGSISQSDYSLQLEGTAAAFREKLLREVALQVADDGRVQRSGFAIAALR